jgi:uncharacterized protein (DUF934 family)
MDQWSDETYRTLGTRSQALFKNKHVLPVAAWVAECDPNATITCAEVVRGLGGRLAPNKALEALTRLCDGGILIELPFPGRPHPRIFQRRSSSFWDATTEFARDAREAQRSAPSTT